MNLHEVLTYPGRADEVFAMLTDEAFWREVAQRTRALRSAVTVRADGARRIVHVARTMPAQVPDVVRALVGSEIEIDQTETWSEPDPSGRRTADLVVRIPGKPVRFPARMTLENTVHGSRQTVSGKVEVRIPFGGGAIAAEIARAVRAAMTVQQQVGGEYLERATRSNGAD